MIRAVKPLQPVKAAKPPEEFDFDFGFDFDLPKSKLPIYSRPRVVEVRREEDEEPRDAFRRTRRQAIDADREHKLPELGGMIW